MEGFPDGYNPKVIAGFQKKLVSQKAALVAKYNVENYILTEQLEGAERMDRVQVIEHHTATINGEAEHLCEIESAIQRCQDRTYGICLDCRKLIPLARLEVVPATSWCVACQPKHKSNHNHRSFNTVPFQTNPLGIFTKKEKVGRRAAT